MSINHSGYFLFCATEILNKLKGEDIDVLVDELVALRERKGRLFILGVGGSAANASHAVNDFRKLCNIEAYAPTDNVAELTARTNDEGWENVFAHWLDTSHLHHRDAILILSVGGGSESISANLSLAVSYAKAGGSKIFGIVGRDGGYTAKNGDCVIIVPTVDETLVTPLTESFQSVILHALVSHPKLQMNKTKW